MVSQSSSVGYTIMGKTADLTVVQKTTIDTLHKEGKTQKVIAKEAGCSQSSVSKHINREAKGRKRCVQAIGITAPWRGLWNKTHSKFGGDSQRVDCSWSQCFKNHYAQTYARHGFLAVAFLVKPPLNNRQHQNGLKTKRTGLLLSGKSMGYWEKGGVICQTQECRRAEGHYQSNLGSHNTWAVPQTDWLHATPHCCSNSGKRSPN